MVFKKLALFFVLLSALSFADDVYNCDSCSNCTLGANTLNRVLNITGSFTYAGTDNCIEVNASNLTIDCNGNTADNTNYGPVNWFVHSYGYNNITVQNCDVTNWHGGIFLETGNNFNILNNTIHQVVPGVHSFDGIKLDNADVSDIVGNEIFDLHSAEGSFDAAIILGSTTGGSHSDNTEVIGNEIHDIEGGFGITIHGTNVLLTNNDIYAIQGMGVFTQSSVSMNNNTITQCMWGVQAWRKTGTVTITTDPDEKVFDNMVMSYLLIDNATLNNGSIVLNSSFGKIMEAITGNFDIIQDGTGLFIEGASVSVDGMGGAIPGIFTTYTMNNETFYSNGTGKYGNITHDNKVVYPVRILTPDDVTWADAIPLQFHAHWLDSYGFDWYDNGAEFYNLRFTGQAPTIRLYRALSTDCYNCTECNTKAGVAGARIHLKSDMTSDSDPPYCIGVTADDVQIDCEGHTISGEGIGLNGITSPIGNDDVHIENCTVANYQYEGIVINNGNGFNMSNVVVQNVSSGPGVVLDGVTNASIYELFVGNTTARGMEIEASDVVDMEKVMLAYTSGGIAAVDSNSVGVKGLITGFIDHDWPVDFDNLSGSNYMKDAYITFCIPQGFFMNALATFSLVSDLSLENITIEGCGEEGMEMQGTQVSSFKDNTVTGNNVGIMLMTNNLTIDGSNNITGNSIGVVTAQGGQFIWNQSALSGNSYLTQMSGYLANVNATINGNGVIASVVASSGNMLFVNSTGFYPFAGFFTNASGWFEGSDPEIPIFVVLKNFTSINGSTYVTNTVDLQASNGSYTYSRNFNLPNDATRVDMGEGFYIYFMQLPMSGSTPPTPSDWDKIVENVATISILGIIVVVLLFTGLSAFGIDIMDGNATVAIGAIVVVLLLAAMLAIIQGFI